MPLSPLTEDNLLDVACNHGLKYIQLGDNLPVHTFDLQRKQNLKHKIKQQDIRLELGARGLTEKHLSTYIELTKYFESPLLRFVIDDGIYTPKLTRVIDILKGFVPQLERENIILGIENHDRYKARELVNLIEVLGSRSVGICLDCVNSLGAGEGLDHVAGLLSPYTVNLHLKDFTIERADHAMGFTIKGAPAGKGMADFPALIEKITKYNRCHSAVLEQWVPFQEDISNTIALEKQWADESLRYLKSIRTLQLNGPILKPL